MCSYFSASSLSYTTSYNYFVHTLLIFILFTMQFYDVAASPSHRLSRLPICHPPINEFLWLSSVLGFLLFLSISLSLSRFDALLYAHSAGAGAQPSVALLLLKGLSLLLPSRIKELPDPSLPPSVRTPWWVRRVWRARAWGPK